ncbi:phage head-tail joining protein [Paraburkholderia megapolitana]|uniref:phage head-tail joining protein n=1 Tax=Paraburkholderia megapolitana TaxID=420953 RepID=UPI0038B7AF2C
MAYTQNDLDRIQAVIAKGELEVQYHDRKVRYRSIAELRAAQTEIVRGLEQGAHRSRVFRIRSGGKGI